MSSSSSSFKRKSTSAPSPLQSLLTRLQALEELVEQIAQFLECPGPSAASSQASSFDELEMEQSDAVEPSAKFTIPLLHGSPPGPTK